MTTPSLLADILDREEERILNVTPEVVIHQVILDNVRRYPCMEAQDIYKLLYQAAMGCEHAVTSESGPRRWMERELSEMKPVNYHEPVCDYLSAEGGVVRINLRPFLEVGGDPEILLQVFINSASAHKGSPARLEAFWQIAMDLASEGELAIRPEDMLAFWEEMKAADLPSVHHSRLYDEVYQPAYRVVVRKGLSV